MSKKLVGISVGLILVLGIGFIPVHKVAAQETLTAELINSFLVQLENLKNQLLDIQDQLLNLKSSQTTTNTSLNVSTSGGKVTTPPGAFSLTTPVNGATNLSLTPTFGWTAASNASSYTLQISATSSFVSSVYNKTGISKRSTAYVIPSGVLASGKQYYWRIFAVNNIGSTGASNAPFWFGTQGGSSDTVSPTVAITSPSNGAVVTTQSIGVSGSASDNVAVASVKVRVNSGTWQIATGTTSWSKSVSLVSGSNLIEAQSFDTSNNASAIASVSVTYNPPSDTAPPTVSVSISPVAPTSNDQVTYSANASDTSGIYSLSITVDGIVKQTCSFATTCSYPEGPYSASSTHSYYATAVDNSSNKNTATTTIKNFTVSPAVVTTYLLSVSVSGSGSVQSSPSGISCPGTCSASYNSGTTVALTATPNSGYSFSGWGGACTGTGSCNVLMDSAKSVSATFASSTGGGGNATSEALWGVKYVSASTAIAVGNNGTIVRSTDGGATWTKLVSGTTLPLLGIAFVGDSYGFVVGGYTGSYGRVILKTTNGTGFSPVYTSTSSLLLTSAAAPSMDTIYAAGSSVGSGKNMLKSIDSGSTWNQVSMGTTAQFNDVAFVDALTGYVVGASGLIRKTTDGGTTWVTQNSGWTSALKAIDILSSSTMYASGDSGKVVKTINGGSTWTPLAMPNTNNFQDLDFITTSTGWVVSQQGDILKTTDGGSTWTPEGPGGSFYGVSFWDVNNGVVVGTAGIIYQTVNGGVTWNRVD